MKRRRNPKLEGEQAECVFHAQAMLRGFAVSRPIGDSVSYDCILDTEATGGGRLWRVQIKSTGAKPRNGRYGISIRLHRARERITPIHADFLAAWVRWLNVWYIVPVAALRSGSLWVYPNSHHKYRRGRWYEQYREAWELLRLQELPKVLSARGSRRPSAAKAGFLLHLFGTTEVVP